METSTASVISPASCTSSGPYFSLRNISMLLGFNSTRLSSSFIFIVVFITIIIISVCNPLSAETNHSDAVDARNDKDQQTAPSSRSASPNNLFFRPSIAVVAGILTVMVSITFLIFLYARHCKQGLLSYVTVSPGLRSEAVVVASASTRRNSGVERAIIELLPVFRFGMLRGHKEGLECAICLSRFEPKEVLRLLPKCNHAFHVECVDVWLDAHSTCPLCRFRVDPQDVLLVDSSTRSTPLPLGHVEEEITVGISGFRRVPGRHSSVGEKTSSSWSFLQKNKAAGNSEVGQIRRSLDSSIFREKSDSDRKDGTLLSDDGLISDRSRFDHKIVVLGGRHRRWSDMQSSDLLYLQSEMIISDSRRFLSCPHSSTEPGVGRDDGTAVIKTISAPEITSQSRFPSTFTSCRPHDDDRRHLVNLHPDR